MSNLSFELAQKHTQTFAENVLHDHHNAMECFDCEEMLESGISAFKWIQTAEEIFRESDASGILDLTVEAENAINQLWEMWLIPVPQAEAQIAQTMKKGFVPDHVDEFKDAKRQAVEIIEANELLMASRRRLFDSLSEES